jgi:hypothetical protein
LLLLLFPVIIREKEGKRKIFSCFQIPYRCILVAGIEEIYYDIIAIVSNPKR